MDIFNRPPPISEDTLVYTIYPDSATASSESSTVSLSALIKSRVLGLLPPTHIWHRDAFELNAVDSGFPPEIETPVATRSSWMLEGRMRVGDCVDDEWCVVWMLREVSKSWDVCIEVHDTDGQFLLIEAADALPQWVTPSNSENRVWIYKSRLHLIPLPFVSPPSSKRPRKRRLPGATDSDDEALNDNEEEEDYLDVSDALKLVRDPGIDTFAPSDAQLVVWKKIESYPGLAKEHTHLTKAYVPSDILVALKQDPSLVQKAVEAFYTRDGIQLRAAHSMNRFPPSTAALSTVRMTRTAYAQLVGQKFHPPKIFGRWSESEGSREWRWRDVGMKIACGFEMLYAESKGRSKTTSTDSSDSALEARKEALRRDPEYGKYIQKLVGAGFFQDELEGSAKWLKLEDQAARVWVEARKKDDASRSTFAALVNTAIAQGNAAGQAGAKLDDDVEEDSDGWLSVDPASLDDILRNSNPAQRSANRAAEMDVDGEAENQVAEEQAKRLKDLAQKVENFVEGEGTLEGAAFEDELLSDDEFSDDPSDGDDSEVEEEDSTPAQPALTQEREDAMAALVEPLPASEYGVMPTSFSKSQKVKRTTLETETTQASSLGPSKPVRRPILMRDKFDGVDSDDESDSDGGQGEMDGDEDERPVVVDDVDVDMEEEEEEFLKFSREALGISDDLWGQIIRERQEKGAFVPSASATRQPILKPEKDMPAPPGKAAASASEISSEDLTGRPSRPPRVPTAGPRPNVNPNLDSFEAVMQAMEEELKRAQLKGKAPAVPTSKPSATRVNKPAPEAVPAASRIEEETEDADIEEAMAAELREALEQASGSDSEGEQEPSVDYNLIKNFLESFKAQGGLSGPVSNLAGRLEGQWGLPRDES